MERDGEQVGVTVDVDAFLTSGVDVAMLLAGSELILVAAGEHVLLAGVDVATNFS